MFARWNPLGDLGGSEGWLQSSFEPAVDVYEFREGVMIYVELPGLTAEDIKIGVHGSTLTISGERRHVQLEHRGVHRVERSYGAFSRSFTLSGGFEADLIEADLRDGVLTLRLPRSRDEGRPVTFEGGAEPRGYREPPRSSTREVRTTGETIDVDP